MMMSQFQSNLIFEPISKDTPLLRIFQCPVKGRLENVNKVSSINSCFHLVNDIFFNTAKEKRTYVAYLAQWKRVCCASERPWVQYLASQNKTHSHFRPVGITLKLVLSKSVSRSKEV